MQYWNLTPLFESSRSDFNIVSYSIVLYLCYIENKANPSLNEQSYEMLGEAKMLLSFRVALRIGTKETWYLNDIFCSEYL